MLNQNETKKASTETWPADGPGKENHLVGMTNSNQFKPIQTSKFYFLRIGKELVKFCQTFPSSQHDAFVEDIRVPWCRSWLRFFPKANFNASQTMDGRVINR
jgi:hypothetical protein